MPLAQPGPVTIPEARRRSAAPVARATGASGAFAPAAGRILGIAGPHLGRLGAEQLAVVGDRLADVTDVQRELYPGHADLPENIDVRLCTTQTACHTNRHLSI